MSISPLPLPRATDNYEYLQTRDEHNAAFGKITQKLRDKLPHEACNRPKAAILPAETSQERPTTMPYITVGKENGANIDIYYKDWGKGQPIVFSHGWPLSADDWDTQLLFFLKHGYRVIAHDRRGHGRSTQTGGGHDMDHYADDLAALTAHLDLKN